MGRVEVGHRHLEDGDVGVRVHRHERHERPVVEAAVGILGDFLVVRHQRRDPGGQVRSDGRVVAHLVVAEREAVEVVRERDRRRRADGHRRGFPVGAHDEDRGGAGQALGPGAQLGRPLGVLEERRRAVAEVQSRESFHGRTVAHAEARRRRDRERQGRRAVPVVRLTHRRTGTYETCPPRTVFVVGNGAPTLDTVARHTARSPRSTVPVLGRMSRTMRSESHPGHLRSRSHVTPSRTLGHRRRPTHPEDAKGR